MKSLEKLVIFLVMALFLRGYGDCFAVGSDSDDDGSPGARAQVQPSRYTFADPTSDHAFKKLFTDPGNKDLLMSFLNSLLEKEDGEQIVGVEGQRAYFEGGKDIDETFFMELSCLNQKGEQHTVGVEKDIFEYYRPSGLFKRVQFYMGSVFSGQLKRKNGCKALKPSIRLILTSAEPSTKPSRTCTDDHGVASRPSGTSYLKDMKWVFVEVPKFSLGKYDRDTQLEELLYAFGEGYKKYQFPIACHEELREGYENADQSRWTAGERMACIRFDMAQRDLLQKLHHAREMARESAREKGRKEERYKNALAMVTGGMTDCEGAIKFLKLDDELATRLRAETAAAGQKRPAERGGEVAGGEGREASGQGGAKKPKP